MLTAAQQALLPTQDDVEFYKEHGWYISKKIFADEELDGVVEATERFYRRELDPSGIPGVEYYMENHQVWGDYGGKLRKHDYASFCCRPLGALVTSPLLGAIAARLAGAQEIRLWHDQLLYKPPQDPARPTNVGWHTDRGYWMVSSSDNMLTAWVPFHDVDEQVGTITMIDGSHHWDIDPDELDFFNSDLEALEKKFARDGRAVQKVPMRLAKGQVSFHHCQLIHGSGPNFTDKPRRSVAVHLQDGPTRYQDFTHKDGRHAIHYNTKIAPAVNGVPDFTDPKAFPRLWPA